MAMIEVQHLQKNFVKTVKEPGLKGALRSFVHPEKQTFEAVKDLTFEVPKGQILGDRYGNDRSATSSEKFCEDS